MTVDLRLRPEAEQDLVEAALWYETNEPGLGRQLLDQVQVTLASIAEHPSAYTTVHNAVRRALVKRFPFGIFYREDNDGVVVIAILHGSRHPQSWTQRV